MNSSDVRKMVTDRLREESKTRALRKEVARNVPRGTVEATMNFIEHYVETTPSLMDTIWVELDKRGSLPQFQPIFDTMFNYWGAQYDVIPDHLGLVGILDDAYLTKRLLENINAQVSSRAGQPLIAIDLAAENRMMRTLLGELVAVQLEAIVTQNFQSMNNVFNQIFALLQGGGLPGMLPISPGNAAMNMMTAELNRAEIERNVDIQMGAMGIV